jgi:hypothetical protein
MSVKCGIVISEGKQPVFIGIHEAGSMFPELSGTEDDISFHSDDTSP